jgi:inner membrane transporter RhtA
MAGTLTFAALFMTPFALVVTGGLSLDPHAFGYAALVMVLGTSAHITMVWAHRWVPASQSAVVLLAEPTLIALGGWAVFGDAPGALEIAGSLVVVSALVGVVRNPVVDDAADESLEPPL